MLRETSAVRLEILCPQRRERTIVGSKRAEEVARPLLNNQRNHESLVRSILQSRDLFSVLRDRRFIACFRLMTTTKNLDLRQLHARLSIDDRCDFLVVAIACLRQ
ncbi:hypothetical protein TIFTF001_034880 [Ficus carica]|uniref:Uncharacterized protein n=1 Tax=Ficus carica TaxID=3494 RepID=A0AA88E1B2_FICCA|nr:hypothetical protein TIFTF001_034857 [Ficus carica]GMN65813.1 hypothetical protein TIFTF001_034880 [Ficus carica]